MAVPRKISSVLSAGFLRRLPSQRPVQSLRFISSTCPRRAHEAPKLDSDALQSAFKKTRVFQNISNRPEAVLAVQKFVEIIKKQGIEMTPGKPPSMLQMSRLFMNSEVRDAAKNLIEDLKKAGIDVNVKEVMEEMAAVAKLGGDSKS